MNRRPCKKIDLHSLFLGLQKEMIAGLSISKANIPHSGAKGEVTEVKWRSMLSSYLPERYKVNKAFVLDVDGRLSQEIDVVIYDRHYSPFLLNQNGALYVPSESVYAVMEVKPTIDRENIEYTGGKVESVRRLRRTSAPIPHAGGKFPPKKPFEIISGLVALNCAWNHPFGKRFKAAISSLSREQRIDLGCSLESGSFEIDYLTGGTFKMNKSEKESALIFFFLHLLARLQQVGTVLAMDIEKYADKLKSR